MPENQRKTKIHIIKKILSNCIKESGKISSQIEILKITKHQKEHKK